MTKPEKNFTASFDSVIAALGLKEGEEEYNRCRAKFFMDVMKIVNDKVARGDPAARSLEADYATLVATRGSQNHTVKMENPSSKGQPQATKDLESEFQVLAHAAGTRPGQPAYKQLLRRFLTAEYAANAEEFCCNARNIKEKNKMFKFQALALVCGLEYDSPRYNKVYNDFFQKTGILLARALESTINHEEASSTNIMAHETKNCLPGAASSPKLDEESATMKSLRNKLEAARLDGAGSEFIAQTPTPEERFEELVLSLGLTEKSRSYTIHRRRFFKYESSRNDVLNSGDDIAIEKLEVFEEICEARGLQQGTKTFGIFKSHFDIENETDSITSSEGSFSLGGFTSADDDSEYALQFQGRQRTSNGIKPNGGKPDDKVVTSGRRSGAKQTKNDHNRAQKGGTQNGGARKTRAEKAKEEFKRYFPNAHRLENWQKLCRDLGIVPVPSSITQCKKEIKKIYVNIYQFLHQIRTGEPATRFSSQKELAKYCNGGTKRKFPREYAKERGALAGLLHYLH
ncbi:hypothetical protein V490_07606 [Pseudogymnoascus sp. VKM F-3557]|nr:hypothetical protein V490_07606 [Pseudogymnoascus sp. VKM F-3557]